MAYGYQVLKEERFLKSARKAGANGYVSKGLGPSEIYSALVRVLNQTAAPAGQAA